MLGVQGLRCCGDGIGIESGQMDGMHGFLKIVSFSLSFFFILSFLPVIVFWVSLTVIEYGPALE